MIVRKSYPIMKQQTKTIILRKEEWKENEAVSHKGHQIKITNNNLYFIYYNNSSIIMMVELLFIIYIKYIFYILLVY